MIARNADLVSVVVTVYNAAPYLGEAIDSVLSQTYRPVELIVVDDGSTDGSGEIAASFGSALTLVRGPRAGIGAARNKGIHLASGDHLAMLDADDRFTARKLEIQMDVLRSRPEVDMVFGHMTEFVSPDVDPAALAQLREPVLDVPWRMTSLMLVHRAAFDRVGPFSTTLRVGVGVDWYARAIDSGLTEAVPPEIVLERRLHASNNGLLEADRRHQYLRVLHESIARRRAASRAPED